MPEQPAGERTEEATPKRRKDARRRGTVAKSNDLNNALGLMAAALLMPGICKGLAEHLLSSWQATDNRLPMEISYASLLNYAQAIFVPALMVIAPLVLVMMGVGLASSSAQVGFVLSGEPMKPTFEKINPLAGIKRLFSGRSLFEGLKASAKMAIFALISYNVISARWDELISLALLTPAEGTMVVGSIIHTIIIRLAVVWLAIAGVDYFFQRKQIDKQLRMTKDELKREMKEQEGSPELKAAIYQKRRKLAQGGMAKKLAESDVLVTNPTHFAVALKYDRSSMHAPMVLAKGQDYLALKMRELATGLDVPIVENKPLARGLYKQCEPGDFVPRDLFGPVAEVLAYVYKSVNKARRTR